MTLEAAVVMVRRILKAGHPTVARFDSIRFLRGLGISFTTARNMVDEIIADKPWYRQRCYQIPAREGRS